MMKWLMRLFRRDSPSPPRDPEVERLQREVVDLSARTYRAALRADYAINRELRLAHEAIVGGRRHGDSEHTPDRRGL